MDCVCISYTVKFESFFTLYSLPKSLKLINMSKSLFYIFKLIHPNIYLTMLGVGKETLVFLYSLGPRSFRKALKRVH